MPIGPIVQQPGLGTVRTASHRNVFKYFNREAFLPGGKLIDGSLSADVNNTPDVRRLQAGKLMGLVTTSKKFRPSIIGVSTSAYTSGATSLTVSAALATEIARLITLAGTSISAKVTGPPSAAGTVASVATTISAASGTTLTITNLAANMIAGAWVQPADGSETAITFLPDGFPIQVVDVDGASVDIDFPLLPIAGMVDSSQLIDWPSDTSLQAKIVTMLTTAGMGSWNFDHLYE